MSTSASALVLLALAASPRLEAQSGALFPQAFRVEHHIVQDDGDGSRFVGEAVTDTYGGSWIVSQRPDGSRLIVDLVRRELTEVRPEKGTYWTVSFDRLAELQGRLVRAEGLGGSKGPATDESANIPNGGGSVRSAATDADSARSAHTDALDGVTVTEVSGSAAKGVSATRSEGVSALDARPGVRHLRVGRRQETEAGSALEVWVDPSIRMTAGALAAMTAFETQVLVPHARAQVKAPGTAPDTAPDQETATAVTAPTRYLSQARSFAGGAVPIRTLRPLAVQASGEPLGSIEDSASRLDALDRFPTELAQIPEGLRRVPHPLEATVRFLEEEAERNAVMSGAASSTQP